MIENSASFSLSPVSVSSGSQKNIKFFNLNWICETFPVNIFYSKKSSRRDSLKREAAVEARAVGEIDSSCFV